MQICEVLFVLFPTSEVIPGHDNVVALLPVIEEDLTEASYLASFRVKNKISFYSLCHLGGCLFFIPVDVDG